MKTTILIRLGYSFLRKNTMKNVAIAVKSIVSIVLGNTHTKDDSPLLSSDAHRWLAPEGSEGIKQTDNL